MDKEQLQEYDRFLDENDWDIYYWATQEEAAETAKPAKSAKSGEVEAAQPGEGEGALAGTPGAVKPAKGEWAQTIGTFKPLYRPVPERWRGSEVLERLRRHVGERSAGEGEGKGEGMAFMPKVRNFDA